MDREEQIVKALQERKIAKEQAEAKTASAKALKVDPTPELPPDHDTEKIPLVSNTGAWQLQDFFELPADYIYHPKIVNKLNSLYEIACEFMGGNDPSDVRLFLSRTAQRLGVNHRENKLDALYEYMNLQKLSQGLSKYDPAYTRNQKEMEIIKNG